MRVPNRFLGSGIWITSRPGFEERGYEIRDYNYDRHTGFGDFNKRESGNVALKKPRFQRLKYAKKIKLGHLSSSY